MTIKMNTIKDTHYGFFSTRSLPPVASVSATAKNAENDAKTTTDPHVRLSVLSFLAPSPPPPLPALSLLIMSCVGTDLERERR